MPAQHNETLHTESKQPYVSQLRYRPCTFHPRKGTGLCGAVAVLLPGHELPPQIETSQVQEKVLLHLVMVGNPLNHSSD